MTDGLDDDAREQQQILAALVRERRGGIEDVVAMLRRTPRYDRDYPAMIRAARRIEDWLGR